MRDEFNCAALSAPNQFGARLVIIGLAGLNAGAMGRTNAWIGSELMTSVATVKALVRGIRRRQGLLGKDASTPRRAA